MKLLIYTLLSNILLFLGLCETGDECRDYDLLPIDMYSADIYFDWIYCDDGNEVTSPEIASELHGKTIVITFY